jgi:hypothetical protein
MSVSFEGRDRLLTARVCHRLCSAVVAFAVALTPISTWAAPEGELEPDVGIQEVGAEDEGKPSEGEVVDEDEASDDAVRAEAIEAFRAATRSYELGRYDAAIAGFERAWELTEAPQLLYNLGQSHWKRFEVEPDIEDLRRAKVFFQNYDKRMQDAEFYDGSEVERIIERIDEQIEQQEALAAERNRPIVVGLSRAEQDEEFRRRLEHERQYRITRALNVTGISFIVLGSLSVAMGVVALTTRLATGAVLDSSSGGSGGVNLASVEQDTRRRRQYLLGGQVSFAGFVAGGIFLPVGVTLRSVGQPRVRKGLGTRREATEPAPTSERARPSAVAVAPGGSLLTVHF